MSKAALLQSTDKDDKSTLSMVDAYFWETLGATKLGHKLLIAKTVLKEANSMEEAAMKEAAMKVTAMKEEMKEEIIEEEIKEEEMTEEEDLQPKSKKVLTRRSKKVLTCRSKKVLKGRSKNARNVLVKDSTKTYHCTGWGCNKEWTDWHEVPHWSRKKKPWCLECGAKPKEIDTILYRCTGGCKKVWTGWQEVPSWSRHKKQPWCMDCGAKAPGWWQTCSK